MDLSTVFRVTRPLGLGRQTYYVLETMTLCRLSLGLGPVVYEHSVPALTQCEHGLIRSHFTWTRN